MSLAPAPSGPITFLNAARRTRDLEVLGDGLQVDVLVVGGGVTGTGVALDAASRGLTVALAERRDLANGTSRFSSKLAHGGLRYLAQGQFGVAWESARERSTLATVTAPHLIRPLPQVIPLIGGDAGRRAALMEVGIRMGDGMRALTGTSRRLLAPMRRVGGAEACLWTPALAPGLVSSAILCWDAQLEDDARLVVALARTAAAYGARILTYCEVSELTQAGARVRDTRSGESFELRAWQVVNAGGVWADRLVGGIELRPSRGSHLLLPAARLGHPRAMLNVPDPHHFGRFVFAIPRLDGLVLVGLTDEPFTGTEIPDAPEVSEHEEHYLLEALSRALDVPLGPEDVVGRFAGLRPLLAGDAARTRDLSRRHAVLTDPDSGAISVVGGKLTTYRRMAEDAVDVVAQRIGRQPTACRTRRLPLVGAARPAPGPALTAGLRRRFGSEAIELTARADQRPELLERVIEESDVLAIELLAAVEREGALCVEDVLDRRTRLGLVPARREAAMETASRITPELARPAASAA